jgi:regulator of replication initiation timing
MEAIHQQLEEIQQQVAKLIRLQQQLQKENVRLRKQLLDAEMAKENQEKGLQSLKQQLEQAQLAKAGWSADEKKQLEKKINQYLKEIDACLAILHNN